MTRQVSAPHLPVIARSEATKQSRIFAVFVRPVGWAEATSRAQHGWSREAHASRDAVGVARPGRVAARSPQPTLRLVPSLRGATRRSNPESLRWVTERKSWIASSAPPPRDDAASQRTASPRHCEERSDEAIQNLCGVRQAC